MKSINVAFTGVSGVGKTTFLRYLSQALEFQHLSAGTIISSELRCRSEDRDFLRLEGFDENQDLLVSGFHRERSAEIPIAILDCHNVVHTETGLSKVPTEVFMRLGITAFLHLSASPEAIIVNRSEDTTRRRPVISVYEMSFHQEESLKAAREISHELAIPILECRAAEIREAKEFVSSVASHL